MNPNPWKWILPLALGCAVGLALPRGLVMIFGTSGSALLVSTVTASSILGGFCGAVVGWVMSSPTLSQDVQTLLMCGILGILATIAADATAAQASMSANDTARVRRRGAAACCGRDRRRGDRVCLGVMGHALRNTVKAPESDGCESRRRGSESFPPGDN